MVAEIFGLANFGGYFGASKRRSWYPAYVQSKPSVRRLYSDIDKLYSPHGSNRYVQKKDRQDKHIQLKKISRKRLGLKTFHMAQFICEKRRMILLEH